MISIKIKLNTKTYVYKENFVHFKYLWQYRFSTFKTLKEKKVHHSSKINSYVFLIIKKIIIPMAENTTSFRFRNIQTLWGISNITVRHKVSYTIIWC